MSHQLIIIAHNIRSVHNVGSLMRTAEGLGISKIYFTGYTPYPKAADDSRLPHLAERTTKQINKTALGAEAMIPWEYCENITDVLQKLRNDNFTIAALEQTADSVNLPEFKPPNMLAILLGSEVEGIDPELLKQVEITLEIPMAGHKESFNVVEAATMAMYHCTHTYRL